MKVDKLIANEWMNNDRFVFVDKEAKLVAWVAQQQNGLWTGRVFSVHDVDVLHKIEQVATAEEARDAVDAWVFANPDKLDWCVKKFQSEKKQLVTAEDIREELARIVEMVAADGLPEPRDLDSAIDAILAAVGDVEALLSAGEAMRDQLENVGDPSYDDDAAFRALQQWLKVPAVRALIEAKAKEDDK